MDITFNTPALLFPAVSLLLIAYTNRYLAIARLIRDLKDEYLQHKNPIHLSQIRILKRRERFIRNMQTMAIASLFCSTLAMAMIFFGEKQIAIIAFGAALILMVLSLAISLRDILLAGGALKIELQELEQDLKHGD